MFPEVSLTRLTQAQAPVGVMKSPSPPTDQQYSNGNGSVSDSVSVSDNGSSTGVILRSSAFEDDKEAAAAEAELLDTLVGLVALRGGTGGMAPPGDGGLGAEGASLGGGRYTARLSEGRESSGRVEESTLLNLLFVPDGR